MQHATMQLILEVIDKRIYHEFEDGIEKSIQGSSIGILRLAQLSQRVIESDRFFYPLLTQVMDFVCKKVRKCFAQGHNTYLA